MTPARWALLILAALSGVVVAYALFIDSSSIKLPLLVSSLAVFGIALALLGFALAGSAVRMGETGHGGKAILTAFLGGLLVLAAAGAVAMAIVLGILASAIS